MKTTVLWVLLLFLVSAESDGDAMGAYETSGYLVYTAFDLMNRPIVKDVRLFNVKVRGEEWLIRTEPVERSRAKYSVFYWEGCRATSGDVIMLTSLAPFGSDGLRFDDLRKVVERECADDLAFASHEPIITIADSPVSQQNSPERSPARPADNVALAKHFRGPCPPVDNSYVALLWFAFAYRPASADRTEQGELTPQIWDDGNTIDRRFLHAVWKPLEGPPHLTKEASFGWSGIRVASDGKRSGIAPETVRTNRAATYSIGVITNYLGLVLPLRFELVRFRSSKPAGSGSDVLTTVVGLVKAVGVLPPEASMEIGVPGKTFVSDYRLAATETHGRPMRYLISSNLSPAIGIVTNSPAYRIATHNSGTAAAPGQRSGKQALLALILVTPAFVLLYLWGSRRLR